MTNYRETTEILMEKVEDSACVDERLRALGLLNFTKGVQAMKMIPWLKEQALSNTEPRVRMVALKRLAEGAEPNSPLLNLYHTYYLAEQDPMARAGIARIVAHIFESDLDANYWLVGILENDESHHVKEVVLSLLKKEIENTDNG